MAQRKGAKWRLPDDPEEIEARRRLLELLALPEAAVLDVPPASDRVQVNCEIYKAERRWLIKLTQGLGLTRHASAAKLVRLLVRFVIAHRWLFRGAPPFDASEVPWVAGADGEPGVVESLETDTLVEVFSRVEAELSRRGVTPPPRDPEQPE